MIIDCLSCVAVVKLLAQSALQWPPIKTATHPLLLALRKLDLDDFPHDFLLALLRRPRGEFDQIRLETTPTNTRCGPSVLQVALGEIGRIDSGTFEKYRSFESLRLSYSAEEG